MYQMPPRAVSVIAIGLLLGCNDADSVPRLKYEAKVHEVDSLKAVIESIIHGPPRLLTRAETALASDSFRQAGSIARELTTKFPGTPEALAAQSILQRAEEALRAEERAQQRQRDLALKGMVKKRDEMRSLTVWRDRAGPAFVNSRSWVGAYIMDPDNGPPFLRMVIYYKASEWLFIERYLVKVDGRDFRFIPDDFGTDAVERDNGYEGIWEWWDVLAEGTRLPFLRALADAKTATIRYEGQQYYRDRAIPASERASLARTLLAFDALTNAR